MEFGNSTQPYDAQRVQKAKAYYDRREHNIASAQRQPYLPQMPRAVQRIYFPSSPIFPSIDDGQQTIEQILRGGYMDLPASDAETAIIQDKQRVSWLGLDDIFGQIREREEIYRKNMLELKWAECYAFNEFARGGWPPSPEQDELYQKRLADLGMQERAERVNAWRDTSALRQLLPESAQQYLSALRKSELLDDIGGDGL